MDYARDKRRNVYILVEHKQAELDAVVMYMSKFNASIVVDPHICEYMMDFSTAGQKYRDYVRNQNLSGIETFANDPKFDKENL